MGEFIQHSQQPPKKYKINALIEIYPACPVESEGHSSGVAPADGTGACPVSGLLSYWGLKKQKLIN
jgi:hypothetical protein